MVALQSVWGILLEETAVLVLGKITQHEQREKRAKRQGRHFLKGDERK